MSFGFDTGEAIPNADVLRLREYTKIMTQVSNLAEALEDTHRKIDLENNFTINTEISPDIIIPDSIASEIGDVSYIVAKLKLNTDTMHEDEDIAINYEVTPNPQMFYDNDLDTDTTLEGAMVDRQASNISLHFFGSRGVFMVSRTNLTSPDDTIEDHVSLYTPGSTGPLAVPAVSNQDLSRFIVSAVNPLAVDYYADKEFDVAAVDTFDDLTTLFSLAGQQQSNDSTLPLPGIDTYFKHRKEYDHKTDRFKTSFRIRFWSNEDPSRTIFAVHTLETDFQLSFKTLYNENSEFTPENYEANEYLLADSSLNVPYVSPYKSYTPTLSELAHLSGILGEQVARINAGIAQIEETLVEAPEIDATELFETVEQNIDRDIEFDTIAAEDTRREFAAMADIAITQELEQILDDQPEDDTDT